MKYIESVLENNKFMCNFKASYENIDTVNFEIQIDTGCQHSLISMNLMYIFLSDEDMLKDKLKWLKCRKYAISHGIESANKNTDDNLNIYNKNITVENIFYNISINDINIGNKHMYVSYDTTGIALLGMSIMKDWDIHIGKDITTGEVKLLACPNNQLNNDYFEALERIFGISSNIQSSLMRNKINKGEQQ
jgi:hypothetical protein